MLVTRLINTPKALILMMWHHVMLEAFNYLILKPL